MIGYNIMVLVENLTRCSYKTLTAKFVQVVKICLFMVVSNSYTKITFLPKQPLLTYVRSAVHHGQGATSLLQRTCNDVNPGGDDTRHML
jgi:hypothetical protein